MKIDAYPVVSRGYNDNITLTLESRTSEPSVEIELDASEATALAHELLAQVARVQRDS